MCVWENAVGVSQKWWMLELSTFVIVFSTPENLLVGISGALWMKERHFLSKKMCFEKQLELRSAYFERYCRNWLSFTELNEHFLIYLFRNPRNGHWHLQNCHHCVQHLWKLTSRDFLSSRNERKPLSQQKCVVRKYCGSISEMVNAESFKHLPLCSAPLKTY